MHIRLACTSTGKMIKRGQNRAFWPLLAPWRGLEPPVYRLGGGRVIHYATRAYAEYSIFCNSWRMLLLPLRRRPLYPTELRGLIQKIFNFAGLQDSNDSIFRRRTLYPGEVRGHIQKIFNFAGLWGSNGSIVRRGALYPIELLARRAFALSVILRLPVLFRQVVLPC